MKRTRPNFLIKVLPLLLLMLGVFGGAKAQVTAEEKRVMMQSFYWDCWDESAHGNWWDFMKPKMQSLSTVGITEIWLPVSFRATNNPSMGYDPYDFYDLGEFAQKVGGASETKSPTETYFGSRAELESLIATMHSFNIKTYADVVFNHNTGGALENNPNTGGQSPTNFTPMSNKYQFHFNDFHPSTFEGSDQGTFGTYPDLCHANPHVMTVLKDYTSWLVNTIKYDGFRYDWVNGMHPWVIKDLQTHHGKFGVTEFWDQNKANCLQYLANTNNTTNTFDFPLFYALRDMCNNSGGYDMRNISSAGVASSQPANAVTFVANHDTDKEAAYKIATEQKMIGYAYILTSQGLPTVFWRDYYNYGLAKSGTPNGIDQLIWVRKNLATGTSTQLFADEDLYVMQRNGTPGLLVGINDNNTTIKTVTIQTKWANAVLKPYAWGSAVSTSTPTCVTTNANGMATISVLPRGYVVYSPDNGSATPFQCGAIVSAPVANPVAGTYATTQNVTLSSATSGASMYYTLDGSAPSTSSTLFAASINVSSALTIRAIAVKAGMMNSSELSASYTIGGSIPSPWVRADIGSVNPTGSATFNSGNSQFTNRGAGADIYGNTDAFHYIYQPVSGDVTITARVESLTNTNAWAKAGVMIRESTNAGASNAFTGITPASVATFQQRTSTGGLTTTVENGGIAAPYWLRVVRSGNSFSSYRSADGATWTQIGSTATITMASQFLVGLALTSHADGTLGTAVYSNVTVVTSAGGTVATPAFSPSGGTFTTPQSVTLSTTTAGATIRYTTNGTNPTTSSPAYSGPISVTATTNIRAFATATGMTNSAIASATYTITTTGTVSTPTFSPSGGTFTSAQSVTLSTTTAGATIRYTTDGTNPTTSSPAYSGPISVRATTTIRAFATAPGLTNSTIASATYTINTATGIQSGGIYRITARHSGKSLDVSGVSLNDGALIHQWDYVGGGNQKWKIEILAGGFYKLTATHSNKLLDVNAGSLNDNANIHQWSSAPVLSQQWSIVDVGGGFFRIVNRNSGKALDVSGSSTANGALVKQFTYNGTTNQQWSLVLITSPAGREAVSETQSDIDTETEAIAVYPSPADKSIIIKTDKTYEHAQVVVTDGLGRILHNKKAESQTTTIDTSTYPEGLYFVLVKVKRSQVSKRFTIKH